MFAYIHTASGITVINGGSAVTLSIDDIRYPKVLDLIDLQEMGFLVSQERFDEALASPKVQIQTALNAQQIGTRVSVTDYDVLYDGKPIHNSLTVRLLDHLRRGISVAPLLPFLDNLLLNPSYRAVQDLYAFLERGKIPLTSDGHFLAYKYVREDYFDMHTGTFDNSVGNVVEMPRNQVDENPEQTCSSGLHACSFEYLGGYTRGRRVVIVKINPKDVVAIPTDYNLSKMRVCRYLVVGEVDELRQLEGDFLASTPVRDEWDAPYADPTPDAPEVYAVNAYFGEAGYAADDPALAESFSSYDEAFERAKELLGPFYEVVEFVTPYEESVLRFE